VPETRPDDDLIRAAAAGDRVAFGELVARHQAAVYRLARAMAGTAAEDVLQDAFVDAWRGAATYRGDASVKAWLLAIARHAAVRNGLRRAPIATEEATLEQLGAAAGWGEDAEALIAVAQRRDCVGRALARVAPDDREILILRDVEDLSGEETARALGIGLAAMKSRLHRARLRLAAALREGGCR
jgi:RNA polymerase sigma-70 factor (ECF subfamily)